jgi:hypothetical protein
MTSKRPRTDHGHLQERAYTWGVIEFPDGSTWELRITRPYRQDRPGYYFTEQGYLAVCAEWIRLGVLEPLDNPEDGLPHRFVSQEPNRKAMVGKSLALVRQEIEDES